MKAILIDSRTREIKEVDYAGNYKNICKAIDSDIMTVVRIDEHNDVFVDDEGLINGKVRTHGMFRYDGKYPAYLAGVGLVLGTDGNGETIATTLSVEDVTSKVAFGIPVRHLGRVVFYEILDITPDGRLSLGRSWDMD